MRYFLPITIDATNLTSSIGLDSDADIYGAVYKGAWSSSYSGGYAKGDVVRKSILLYESQADANTVDPEVGAASETPTWIELGKINRYRMFDEYVGGNDQYIDKCVTSATGEITTQIVAGGVNSIALFDLDANSVTVEVLNSSGETVWDVVYDISPPDRDVGSYTEFFFTPFPAVVRRNLIVYMDWLTYSGFGEKIKVTIGGYGTISCGNCYMGQAKEIAKTRWGIGSKSIYYGQFDTNPYGQTKHVPGVSSDFHDFDIYIEKGEESRVYKILKELKAKDLVIDINNKKDGYEHLIGFGNFGDFNEVMEGFNNTHAAIEFMGRI